MIVRINHMFSALLCARRNATSQYRRSVHACSPSTPWNFSPEAALVGIPSVPSSWSAWPGGLGTFCRSFFAHDSSITGSTCWRCWLSFAKILGCFFLQCVLPAVCNCSLLVWCSKVKWNPAAQRGPCCTECGRGVCRLPPHRAAWPC